MTLAIRLFGGVDLRFADRPLPPIRSRVARSLFAYLVTQRATPQPRPHLCDLFWPEQDESTARRRLSQALWEVNSVLRQAASPATQEQTSYLLAELDTVQFDPRAEFWLDVARFEAQLAADPPRREGLKRALALYTGDFLEGYYDDWILYERERLHTMYVRGLERLIAVQKAEGAYADAHRTVQRLLRAEPLREAAWQEAMRLCVLLDRPRRALVLYEECCTRFQTELGDDPSPATHALAARIQASVRGEAPVAADATDTPRDLPLVGRHAERTRLVRAVDRTLAGRGGIVLLEGEPGVGKTCLLEQIRADAAWRGVQVLWGHSREFTGEPLAALRQALSQGISPLRAGQVAQMIEPVWLRACSRLLPALERWLPELPPHTDLRADAEQRRLWEAVTQLLLALSCLTPLLLILDDLHWTDEATLDFLQHLAPHARDNRLLIVLSYRPLDAEARPGVWTALQALDREAGRARVELRPLDGAATATLVQEALDLEQASPAFVSRLHAATGGNPLFVLETLRHLREEGLLRRANGGWSTPWDGTSDSEVDLPLAPRLRHLVRERLAQLAPPVRTVAEAAAVLQEELAPGVLQQTAGLAHADVAAAVVDLVRRGFLREESEGARWRHDALRQAVYEAIPPRRLWAIHHRAAYALEAAAPEQVAALARHFTIGEVWEKAVRYHLQVGERAADVYAHATALDAYAQVLTILDEHAPLPPEEADPIRYQIYHHRHTLHWMQGRLDEQDADTAALVAVARDLADPRRLTQALLERAQALYAQNRADEAIQVAEEALSLAHNHHFFDLAALARTYQGDAYLRMDHHVQAETALHDALRYWEKHGSLHPRRPGTHGRLALLFKRTGRFGEAEEALQQALAAAEANQDRLWIAIAYSEMTAVAVARGEYAMGIALGQETLARMRALGFRLNEPVVYGNVTAAHLALGQYGQAADCIRRSLAGYRQHNNQRGVVFSLSDLADLCCATGRFTEAAAALDEAQPLADELQAPYLQGLLKIGLAQLHWRQGAFDQAQRWLDEASPIVEGLGTPVLRGHWHLLQGILHGEREAWSKAASALAEAETVFAAAEQSALAAEAASHRAWALWNLGEMETALQTSRAVLHRAQARESGERPVPVLFHRWQILTAAGEDDEATAVLAQAMAMLQRRADSLPDAEWQREFWENVREHRMLRSAWEAQQPKRIEVRLPHMDAPIGRPLHDDEWITVRWTVDAPEDEAIRGKKQRRQQQILRLIREAAEQKASPRVDDLAAVLDVTPKTIKRDLAALRKQGHEVITRGSR